MQETFASIWRSARTYKPERGPGAPWLYGVARNAIVDRSRARTEPPAEAPDEPSLDASPEERAEQAWTSWRVHRALEAAARARARGDRARLLERPLAERGGGDARHPARHREDAHAQRAAAARRRSSRRRSNEPGASTTSSTASGLSADERRRLEQRARAARRGRPAARAAGGAAGAAGTGRPRRRRSRRDVVPLPSRRPRRTPRGLAR